MAAQDGQTLDQQSPETQAAFQAAYGGNAASAWEGEHDAAIGADTTSAPVAAPAAPAGVPQTAGGGGTTTIDPTQTMQGLTPEQVAKMRAGIIESSGLSIKQLNEQMRQFDAQLDWQKQMWQQQGLPQLAIQQRAADLEQQKFEQLAAQATRQQNWVEQIGTRQAALAEKAQADANAIAQGQLGVAQGQLGLGQSQLGLDTLKTAATLTGPADWIRATNYARGVQQTNLPDFINRLLTGQGTAALGGPAPGTSMSSPQSMINLANQVSGVGGGSTAAGTNPDYAAQRLQSLFAGGGQALSPQALEGLTTTEKSMLQGGGADVGADVGGFMDQYARSRIGQSAAAPGTGF